jgi:ADP-ribose pyrophosphatase YjhB (NUDIX family)
VELAFVYCPRCGAPLARAVAFGRVRPACLYCHFIQFQDPKVAVAGLVAQDGQVMLVRRLAPPRAGLWALPAGYMEQDELPEEAVRREVSEETGLEVRAGALDAVTALGGWQEQRGILLIYRAELLGGEPRPGDDAAEARWFTPAEIPWQEIAFPSTADALRAWAGRETSESNSRPAPGMPAATPGGGRLTG